MNKIFHPSTEVSSKAHISTMDQYRNLYERSIKDPIAFWEETANRLSWYESWHEVRNYDFVDGKIEWWPQIRI